MAMQKFMVKIDLGTLTPETPEALALMRQVGHALSGRGFAPEKYMELTPTIVGSGDEAKIDEWRAVKGVQAIHRDVQFALFAPK